MTARHPASGPDKETTVPSPTVPSQTAPSQTAPNPTVTSPTVTRPTDAEQLVATTALALAHELQDEADRQRESSPDQARTVAWCADRLQERATDTAWHARVARTPPPRPATHPRPTPAPATARPGWVRHLAWHLGMPVAWAGVLLIPFLVLAAFFHALGLALLFLLFPLAAAVIAHLLECGRRVAAHDPDGSELSTTG